MGLAILNSPWTARAGTVRGPCGPRTATYDDPVGFLQTLVMWILLRVCKGAVRHSLGSRTGPYGSRMLWKTLEITVRGRMTPVRALHGAHVESYELFDQTISVQPCQALRVP